ncbi:BatD family protein [Verrucomicrobium sp. 3C]|uniref:BatD family protein n=1 Tax=Verrucomicrobium sp. 3C TaxID=1134055 RepID=UPI0003A18AC8|nr:BatD family protein [Verrucomicrobium sp. 3C]
MNRFLRLLFGLLLSAACFPCALLRAQSAHWLPLESSATLGTPYRVELIVEGGIPQSDPELPAIPYVEASSAKRESSANPGSASGPSVAYRYTLHPLRAGPHAIPAFPLATDRGMVSVPAFTFWVGEPSFSPSFASSADASLTLFRNEVWQGEPFPVEYRLLAHAGAFLEITGQPEWTPADLLVDRWSRPERVSGEWRGAFFSGLRYSALAIALTPGRLSLPSVSQHVNMETGNIGHGLFSQAIIRPLVLRSAALSLYVKPLPAPPKDGFSQAVGTFDLVSQMSPSDAHVGEPATWTLRIQGMGNWTTPWNLPTPAIPSGLRVIEPTPQQQNDPDSLFCGSLVIERILVAERPGRYVIPPYRFTYFDPLAGTYRTALARSTVLTVTPRSSSAGLPLDGSSSSLPTTQPSELVPKKRLPKAPLSGSARGLAPLENRWLLTEACGGGIALLVLWLILALRHARLADPLQRRRVGLRRLRRIHREILRSRSEEEGQRQLFRWQSAIRDAWLLVPATPELAELRAALERAQVDQSVLRAWMTLWQEAEVHLYAREAPLPADWVERSQEQARRIRIPRQSWKRTFALRHFFPVLTVSSLLLSSSWSIQALDAYRSGRFAESSHLWERILQRSPTDWIARTNYGAALSQEGRWGEALAQWSSAFLLAPRDADVRWNFALAIFHCPGVDARLAALDNGPLWFRWISIGSPAEWQILLAIGLLALFFWALLLLLSRYRCAQVATSLRRALLALGLGAISVAATAVGLYGPMANPRAGLVTGGSLLRSVPTDVEQQSSPVFATTLVVVGKPFLHWVQACLSDSRAGWLRAETIVPLFRPPFALGPPPASAAATGGETALPAASGP